MRGFTKVPNDVITDASLSPGARVAYGVLKHLAWRAGRDDEQDVVRMPSLQEIAVLVGISKNTAQAYVKELRDCGLVAHARVANQSLYAIFDTKATTPDDLAERKLVPKTGMSSSQNLGRAPVDTSPLIKDPVKDQGTTVPCPAVALIDGQNLPFNSLTEAVGERRGGSSAPAIAAALNGRSGKPGIRAFFWLELVEWAEEHNQLDALADAAGERFERALAAAIGQRAQAYHDALPGAVITPSALLSWWTRLPRMPVKQRAMTPDEMARFPG